MPPAESHPSSPMSGLTTTSDQTEDKPEAAPSPDEQSSRRESLRARLREREQRLSMLVSRSQTETSSSIIDNMKTIKANLQQMEAEKSELEKELERLKNVTDDDDFLKEKMTGVQEGFMKQVKVIQGLEDELVAKRNEIEHLREELVSKLRRIVELEFDLETHDVHYTEYAAEQFKLGEEALAEIKSKENGSEAGNESLTSIEESETSPNGKKKLSPRRAQKLISKLLSDLDNLEARYKEEKLTTSSEMEKIRLENEEIRTKLHITEDRLAAATKDGSELGAEEQKDVAFLRKRVESLEAKRSLYREEMDKLQIDLKQTRKDAAGDAKKATNEIDRLRLENEAMKSRIRSLETDIMDGDPTTAQFALIEKRIRENYETTQRLEAAAEIKDRQIATLKKEVSRLRMKEIANGDTQGRNFSQMDTDLLRSTNGRYRGHDDMSESNNGDSSLVTDLQQQLQQAQQMLVKKDQELVIERAKAASTAAGLLARITELTGKKPDKHSKQVPLRFYL